MYDDGVSNQNAHEIGDRLRKHRESHPRITLAKLSAETKVLSVSRISNYEQGLRLLKAKEAQIISGAFERLGKPISAASLLGIEKTTNPDKEVGALSMDEEILLKKYRQMSQPDRDVLQAAGDTFASKKQVKKKAG